jgi:hypothetical protein
MQAHLFATVEPKADGVNLAAYPGLTYAPDHWGPGVRFSHNGREVKEVVNLGVDLSSDTSLAGAVDQIAEMLGVSFGDVCDAIKFLRDQGAI